MLMYLNIFHTHRECMRGSAAVAPSTANGTHVHKNGEKEKKSNRNWSARRKESVSCRRENLDEHLWNKKCVECDEMSLIVSGKCEWNRTKRTTRRMKNTKRERKEKKKKSPINWNCVSIDWMDLDTGCRREKGAMRNVVSLRFFSCSFPSDKVRTTARLHLFILQLVALLESIIFIDPAQDL